MRDRSTTRLTSAARPAHRTASMVFDDAGPLAPRAATGRAVAAASTVARNVADPVLPLPYWIWTITAPRTIPTTSAPTTFATTRSTLDRLPAATNAAAASKHTVPADTFTIPRNRIRTLSQLPGWTRPTW